MSWLSKGVAISVRPLTTGALGRQTFFICEASICWFFGIGICS